LTRQNAWIIIQTMRSTSISLVILSPPRSTTARAARAAARARARAAAAASAMRHDAEPPGRWAYPAQEGALSSPHHAHATGTRRFLACQHCLRAAVAKWTTLLSLAGWALGVDL
jgi:hypothetical protein